MTSTNDFNHTLDSWIAALDEYTFKQICAKPSTSSWSLGQVYIHLVEDTRFYMEQIRDAVSTDENSSEEASPFAKSILQNNEFPDEKLEGAPSNASIPQPESKEQLLTDLQNLKIEMNEVAELIASAKTKGKTKHPGFAFFSAQEWFRLAELHLRHHFRQKRRIDDFLKSNP